MNILKIQVYKRIEMIILIAVGMKMNLLISKILRIITYIMIMIIITTTILKIN